MFGHDKCQLPRANRATDLYQGQVKTQPGAQLPCPPTPTMAPLQWPLYHSPHIMNYYYY